MSIFFVIFFQLYMTGLMAWVTERFKVIQIKRQSLSFLIRLSGGDGGDMVNLNAGRYPINLITPLTQRVCCQL